MSQKTKPAFSGFTIIELLVTVAILSIITAMGIASFTSTSSKLRGEVWDLRAALYKAKSIAIRTYAINGSKVTVTFYSTNQTYAANTPGVSGKLTTGVTLDTSSCSSVAFDGLGRGQNCDVTLRGGGKAMTVRVNKAGRIWVE